MIYTYFRTWGSNILLRYVNDDGEVFNKKINSYKPTLYRYIDQSYQGTESFKSLLGKPLRAQRFESIKDAKDFVKTYKDVEGFEIEGNSNYAQQFIIELYNGKRPNYNGKHLRGAFFDIEIQVPRSAGFPTPKDCEYPINLIAVYDTIDQDYVVFGLGEWDQNEAVEEVKDLPAKYYAFEREEDLLREFILFMNSRNFIYTCGWYSQSFDMPYIVLRTLKIMGEAWVKKLSPFELYNVSEKRFDANGNPSTDIEVELLGLPHLDYMLLYKKHVFVPRESYSLDFISQEELGVQKLEYEGTLSEFMENDWNKFVDYNIRDVQLVKLLDEKLKLTDVTWAISYFTLSNYEDTLGTTKVWEQLMAKYLYNIDVVPKFRKSKNIAREFPGGFVKDPAPGFYEWILTEDLNSLYPHLEMQVNIGLETYMSIQDIESKASQCSDEVKDYLTSKAFRDEIMMKQARLYDPETKYVEITELIEGQDLGLLGKLLRELNLSMSASYHFYSKDKLSYFSAIKKEIYKNRKEFKKKMKQEEQLLVLIEQEIKERGLV